MTIRAITFDFWGTLFRDANGSERHQLRVDALCAAAGVEEAAADAVLLDVMAEFMRHHLETQHTLTPIDAVHMACDRLNAALAPEAARALADSFGNAILEHPPAPIEDALEAVRAAAARTPIAIISDTGFSPGANLRILLEREAFLHHFSALTFSDETGMAKPQLPMFERTAHLLGAAPHELLHLGDLEPTDIVGAHQAGGKAGLFVGGNARYLDTTRADYVFPDWRSFIELLPELT